MSHEPLKLTGGPLWPSEPRLHGHFHVEARIIRGPYKCVVLDESNRPVAFSTTRENAQHWCDELNTKGYIEDPD